MRKNLGVFFASLVVAACHDTAGLGDDGGAGAGGQTDMGGEPSGGSVRPGSGGSIVVSGGRTGNGGATISGGAGGGAGAPETGGYAGSPQEQEPFPCLESDPSSCNFGEDFAMIWRPYLGVTGLPLVTDGTYDFVVDWGDGTSGHVTSADDPDARHSYPVPTNLAQNPYVIPDETLSTVSYGVRVVGVLRGWSVKQALHPITGIWDGPMPGMRIVNWGSLAFGATEGQFERVDLQEDAPDAPDLSHTTSLRGLLREGKLSGEVGNWDLSGVSDLSRAFDNAHIAANTGIGDWDVSNVENMTRTFAGAESESDIALWNVGHVQKMDEMFRYSVVTSDLSGWDVSNVTSMISTFEGTTYQGKLSAWNVAAVRDMSHMFARASFDGNLSAWDVSKVENMSHMFDATNFNGDLSAWDVSKVENMSFMFAVENYVDDADNGDCIFDCEWLCYEDEWPCGCERKCRMNVQEVAFDGDLSGWDTSAVTNMSNMFYASYFQHDISDWDVSAVTDMSYMFAGSVFNGDISEWNVSSVRDMTKMFGHALGEFVSKRSSFDGDVSDWDVSNVESMQGMFDGAFSRTNYDALLIGWSTQSVRSGVWLTVTASYSGGSPAAARQTLIDTFGWRIDDDGLFTP